MNCTTIECLMAGTSWKLVYAILDEEPGTERCADTLVGIQDTWNRFRSVCKISNDSVVEKIILNMKLVQLRNYYLCKTTDEAIFKNVTGIINSNYIMIMNYILSNPACANSFVQNLRKLNYQALEMLLEICEILKQQDSLILTALVCSSYLDHERPLLQVHFGL